MKLKVLKRIEHFEMNPSRINAMSSLDPSILESSLDDILNKEISRILSSTECTSLATWATWATWVTWARKWRSRENRNKYEVRKAIKELECCSSYAKRRIKQHVRYVEKKNAGKLPEVFKEISQKAYEEAVSKDAPLALLREDAMRVTVICAHLSECMSSMSHHFKYMNEAFQELKKSLMQEK